MKRVLSGVIATAAVVSGFALTSITVEATNINSNVGSIIKTSGSTNVEANKNVGSIIKTDGSASNVNENVGSIVKIDGKGRNVNDVLKEVSISKNVGSIIKVSNVCGSVDGSVDVSKNVGSIVKVESTGSCASVKTTAPTTTHAEITKTSTPEHVVTSSAPVVTTDSPKAANTEMPTKLPETGVATTSLVATLLGALTAGGLYFVRRS